MKQLFLFICILFLCCCNTQKKLFQHQKETTNELHLEADSLHLRYIQKIQQSRSYQIQHIQLSPPDSSRQQSIQAITFIEIDDKETKEEVLEKTGIYSSVVQLEKDTETTEKSKKQTKTRFHLLLWVLSILVIVFFIRYKYRG